MAGLLFVFGILLACYVKWCRIIYWRMRLDVIADATALSAARAQAQMLNRIAEKNLMMNTYLPKLTLFGHNYGTISASKYKKLMDDVNDLRNKVYGFKTYPSQVGRVVAKLNGADLLSPYFPYPMDSYLQPETVYLWVRMPLPSPPLFTSVKGAFYVRIWSPDYIKAQPPHKTTWLIRKNGFRAISTAGVWLDVPVSSLTHNGGFPRKNESILHGIGVQSFYPQFNARLLPRTLSPDRLLDIVGRKGEDSNES
jgi:hypothetical protein